MAGEKLYNNENKMSNKLYVLVKYIEDWREQLHPVNVIACKTKEQAELEKKEFLKKFKFDPSHLIIEEIDFAEEVDSVQVQESTDINSLIEKYLTENLRLDITSRSAWYDGRVVIIKLMLKEQCISSESFSIEAK